MAVKRPRRFRLSFVGPIEDQPRLIRAYGKACEGEFALVMRPHSGRAVLVLITKKDGAFAWRSWDSGAPEGVTHTTATVLRDGVTQLHIEDGSRAGELLSPASEVPRSLAHGAVVDVSLTEDAAHVHLGGFDGDVPVRPMTPFDAKEAVRLVKTEQKSPPPAGPTTLRGRWTGVLICDDGAPKVELKRKLASYGTLFVRSDPTTGWSWSFEREAKWFTEDGASSGEGLQSLSQAIEAGVLGAMSLVRQACGFRDTRRRAAHDSGYAERHPIREPKPMRDPTERLGGPRTSPRKRRVSKKTVARPESYERMPKKKTESAYNWARRLLAEADTRVGEGHHHVVRELLDQAGSVVATLSGSKAARLHERMKYIEGKLEEVEPDATPVHAANTEKDQALIEAFSAAVASSL